MADQTAAKIIIFFTCSLVFSSLVISWVSMQALGVGMTGITFAQFYTGNGLDLTGTDSNDKNIVYEGSNWNFVSGTGLISTETDGYILFDNSGSPNAGSHTNMYKINNPNMQDYSIVLSKSPVRTQEVVVSNDGFHVVDTSFIDSTFSFSGEEIYFYPYPNANQLTDVTIKTDFNPALSSPLVTTDGSINMLDFSLNGNLLFSVPHAYNMGMQMEPLMKAYYGGVGCKDNVGLVLSQYQTSASQAAKNVLDIPQLGLAYLWAMVDILGWNPNSQILPPELNLLLIKSQEFCIAVGIWFWIRG